MTTDIGPRLQQALQHHRGGRLGEAEALYRDILHDAPNQTDAQYLLGVLLHQKGNFAAAETLVRQAVAAKPESIEYLNNLGNILLAQGKHVDAVAFFERAVALQPDNVLSHMNLAAALRRQGRLDAAAEKYKQIVALRPDLAEGHSKLAVVLTMQEQLEGAIRHFRRALELKPDHLEARASLGNVLRAQGQLDEAAAHYVQVLAVRPNFPEMHYGLGMVRKEEGKLNEAAECFSRAIALRGDYADAHDALGDVRRAQGRPEEARKCYQRALETRPDHEQALRHLELLERRYGAIGDPLANYRRAVKHEPNSPEALTNLGLALLHLGKRDSAEAYLVRALELRPDFPQALYGLGALRHTQNRIDDAEQIFRRALAVRPDFPEALSKLGVLLMSRGRPEEACAKFRRALALKPDDADAHTSLIFALDFVPSAGFPEHQAERQRWFERHGKRFSAAIQPHGNDRDPERKLRVGYVSADFRRHSAVYSFGPVLRHHDRSRFEVTCYSGVTIEDDATAELRQVTDHWHSTLGLTDEELAALVRSDGIDILIDLSGHSDGNRLLVFARKPAPVQVTAWGHGTGTGLKTIDYFFTDPITVPAEVRHLFAEQTFDLPCIIAYEAPGYAPDVAPPPSAAGAPLTFGSLNRLSKVADTTLAVWARLLLAVPESRLLIKDRQLQTQGERERIVGEFGRLGVSAERLVLQGGSSHAAHLAAYSEVDIALDPFPQNGGITTFEALWMGVPVIALLGSTIPSRVAAAILSALDFPDWVATNEADYIEIAVHKAADRDALAALRRDMRRKFALSRVGNPKLYTEAVEAAYREMWRRWCQR